MELPNRKPNRNAHIDYNRAGAYFLTLCVQDRRPILSEIGGDGSIILTEAGGKITDWKGNTPDYFRNLDIAATNTAVHDSLLKLVSDIKIK